MRLAIRSLIRQPVFATVVVLSLAIGIALDTTMYGVLDALIRPRIDMRNPAQLYWIRLYGIRRGQVDNRESDLVLASGLRTYESSTRSDGARKDVIAFGPNMLELSIAGVASNFFQVTGARVLAGRTFVPSDEAGEVKPIVITDRLAEDLFPKGQSPVGARVTVGNEGRVVVGVVSQASNFPREKVMAWEISAFNPRGAYIRLIRLRDGTTREEAERELSVVSARLATAANVDVKDVAFRFHQASAPDFQVEDFELALILAVTAVLVVACANLANIQLARGIGRRRELALRSALGASRGRIVGHLLTESGLLVLLGLALGLVGTYWGSKLLVASIPSRVGDYIVEPQFSWRVLMFSLVATTFCLIVVGLFPALAVSRADPNDLLKSGAGTGATRHNRRIYGILVSVEIGLALVLTSGSVVLLRSWLRAVAPRFTVDMRSVSSGVIALSLSPGAHRYTDVLNTVNGRLEAVPGAVNVAAKLYTGYEGGSITVDDGVSVRERLTYGRRAIVTTASVIQTLGLPILDGRDFLPGDEGVVIVDRLTAWALWGSKSPIGALVKLGSARSSRPYARVIGVVPTLYAVTDPGTAAYFYGRNIADVYYAPRQSETFEPRRDQPTYVFIDVRSKTNPEHTALLTRQRIQTWPDARITALGPFLAGLETEQNSTRFIASLFTLFAVLGVGLAAFGVYGVVAHSVAERRRELGLRLALGASSRDILHSVLRESVVVALAGTALGLLMTKYGVFLLKRLSIGGDVYNAPLFAGVALLLGVITATAAFVPALRATRIDPTESLRNE